MNREIGWLQLCGSQVDSDLRYSELPNVGKQWQNVTKYG